VTSLIYFLFAGNREWYAYVYGGAPGGEAVGVEEVAGAEGLVSAPFFFLLVSVRVIWTLVVSIAIAFSLWG
jgi:hypothetical protein